MTESTFNVCYAGPALEAGVMEVRDLASALLALSDVFREAGDELHPERPGVSLTIKATEKGSFDVLLILRSAWEDTFSLWSGDPITALANFQALVIGEQGVFALIKRIGRRRVARQEPLQEAGQVRFVLADGEYVEVPESTARLYGRVDVHRHARQVLEPLLRDGIEVLQFRSEETVSVRLGASDVEAFDGPHVEPAELNTYTQVMVLTITSAVLVGSTKWRLTDGTNTFHVAIADEAFLERVASGDEAFRSGDMLRCNIRVVQSETPKGLHTEYEAIEILEHLQGGAQLRFGDDA